MIKENKGITLVVLVITIVVMLIILSTIVTISLDRFEMNDIRKMINDIELLKDAVSNYNLKYGEIPILDKYELGTGFATDSGDYYIINLKALQNISLNYGKDGFENPNQSNDVYIINELSHIIYYAKGINFGGEIYHSIDKVGIGEDKIPPSSPQINIISGVRNSTGLYITQVDIEIIPGKDNWSGIYKTIYSINGGSYITLTNNNIVKLETNGTYTIKAISYDNANNASGVAELSMIKVHITHDWDGGRVTTEPTCVKTGITTYTCIECGATKTEEIPATNEHTWNSGKTTTAATCVKSGTKTYACTVCGTTKTEEIPATGEHTWDNGKETKAATCTTSGIKTYTCIVCGETKTEEIKSNGEHTWDSGKITTQATCATSGVKTYTCTVCGETKQVSLGKGSHKMRGTYSSNWNHKHKYEYKCSVCGLVEESYYEWHVPIDINSPCSSWQCRYCGDVVKAQITMADIENLYYMWSSSGVGKGAYECYLYFWQYKGYTEEDLNN